MCKYPLTANRTLASSLDNGRTMAMIHINPKGRREEPVSTRSSRFSVCGVSPPGAVGVEASLLTYHSPGQRQNALA